MKVITLNKEMFSKRCSELVSKLEIQPDVMVGILRGGGYIVDEIKDSFKTTQFYLTDLRRVQKWMDHLAQPFILKLVPYNLSDKLRMFRAKRAEKSLDKLSIEELQGHELRFNFDAINKDKIKNILIVDDAIDTGRTMFIVKNNLSELFPNSEIEVAVISWTMENSIVVPDYYLFKQVLVRFPWSKDYKEKDFG